MYCFEMFVFLNHKSFKRQLIATKLDMHIQNRLDLIFCSSIYQKIKETKFLFLQLMYGMEQNKNPWSCLISWTVVSVLCLICCIAGDTFLNIWAKTCLHICRSCASFTFLNQTYTETQCIFFSFLKCFLCFI